MLRSRSVDANDGAGRRLEGPALFGAVLVALLLLAIPIYLYPQPIELGPVTLVGPACDDLVCLKTTVVAPGTGGRGPTTNVSMVSSVMRRRPETTRLTFGGNGFGGVYANASNPNGAPLRVVNGSRYFFGPGLTIAVR